MTELPLFPLQTVLFPGGLLSLKVFEARYLDLAAACLRERRPFGVVALLRGHEVRRGDDTVVFEDIGVVAELLEVDSARPGILQLRCRGTQRFRIGGTRQQADGLWIGEVELLPDDDAVAPAEPMLETVRGLANAIASLKGKGVEPFEEPYQFDKAGWVANRWCEILPIPLAAKQKLMELPDGRVRLGLVDEYLRGKGVVK
ncbi:LON peptidase substrate-binding domain-containing protein [uncultured Piscinibacter sp.]|uniref:LON peptidase substrate-binding domain-containing protein n=1 Tax=uncultured Piscinibacter sp. TaxID=1131835 RepID=UPI0026355B3A|nr:LON peptidase substrate-binding domain-containing protein [uncultured Piscinibacter sp.]